MAVGWLAFFIVLQLPAIYHRKLHVAEDWHRWEELLRLLNRFETILKYHFIKLPPSALGRYRAKAVAASGNLDAALREYQQYENQPGCPSWLHKAFVGSIHDAAKQHDKALEYNLKALAEKQNPSLYWDLANRYLRYKKDDVKEREAFREAV